MFVDALENVKLGNSLKISIFNISIQNIKILKYLSKIKHTKTNTHFLVNKELFIEFEYTLLTYNF